MFFCDPCRVAQGWPGIIPISTGPCEVCGRVSSCYDVPSKHLPDPRNHRLTPVQTDGSLTSDERGEKMKCTEQGCDKEATHLVGTIVLALSLEDYREVCKKHGKQYALNYGYHLMKGKK